MDLIQFFQQLHLQVEVVEVQDQMEEVVDKVRLEDLVVDQEVQMNQVLQVVLVILLLLVHLKVILEDLQI